MTTTSIYRYLDRVLNRWCAADTEEALLSLVNSRRLKVWRDMRTAKHKHEAGLNARHGASLMLAAVRKRQVRGVRNRLKVLWGGYRYHYPINTHQLLSELQEAA